MHYCSVVRLDIESMYVSATYLDVKLIVDLFNLIHILLGTTHSNSHLFSGMMTLGFLNESKCLSRNPLINVESQIFIGPIHQIWSFFFVWFSLSAIYDNIRSCGPVKGRPMLKA